MSLNIVNGAGKSHSANNIKGICILKLWFNSLMIPIKTVWFNLLINRTYYYVQN